jgi:hypothetical protein
MSDERDLPCPWYGRARLFCLLVASLLPALALAQEQTGYLLGEQQGLEMIVHVIGEVQRPGEYRVRDRTDVLDLLAKAGGPTEFARLSAVTVRRSLAAQSPASVLTERAAPRVEILQVDVEKALHHINATPPPVLRPGDVVLVPKNSWSKYRRVSTILRDVAAIATVYLLYVRVVEK